MVVYGRETWSLALRKKHRLWVFQNRGLRRIFGPKREEVTGDLRQLYNEKLHNLYSYPSIIRMIKSRTWAGHVARIRIRRMYIGYWWEARRKKKQLGSPRRRWIILKWTLEG
jgi:hypothetical protein